LWIYASDQHSFKVGEAIRPLGALVQDRQSAIVADETKKAPMFPMSVRVEGVESAPRKDWNMEVAEERFMTAGMVASSLGSIVDATISERREMSWSLRSKLTVQGHAPIELRDQGVTSGGLPDAADWGTSLLVRAVGDTLNNPWENASIERIESVFTVHYDRDTLRLRGVELLDESVDPGEKARVLLHLRPYSGPEVQKTISITMPTELAGKEVELEILPGYEVFPDVSAPENLRALLSNAARMAVAPKGIVVQYRVPSQGLAFAGHIAPRLPSFALDLLRPTHASIAPDLIPSYKREVVQLDAYIDGRDRIRVKVRAPKT
nr:hypothetical protein [Polyangiaceae bacterium]